MLSYKGLSAAQKFTLRMGFALALAATLAGCAVGPKYHRPTVNLEPFHNAPSIESLLKSYFECISHPQLAALPQDIV